MSVLRNLEAKLGGLVEGAFGRAFKASVQPVELAHKLAKEMEDNQMASVSRVYVPNHYRVFLSPADREQFASYEPALRKELSDYLLEHARQERLALTSRPQVEFHTDDRLDLGEFGIQAQLLGRAGGGGGAGRAGRRRPRPRATSGTRWSTRPTARRACSSRRPTARQALLVGEGRRNVLSGSRVVVGRSRDCDSCSTTQRLAPARRAAARGERLDGGRPRAPPTASRSTGGASDQAGFGPATAITIGVTDLTFELE